MKASKFVIAALGLLVSSVTTSVFAASAQDALAASLAETSNEIARTGNQLQTAVKSLEALTSQTKGDLRPTYEAFTTAIAETQSSAKYTVDRAQKMRDDMVNYFTKWQTEVAGINNPDVKASAQKRLSSVQQGYEQLTGDLATVGQQFRPLLSDLNDIKTALDSDLTVAGVKNLKKVSKSASSQMESLHKSLNGVLKKLNDTQKMLGSSTGK
jgi:septal ring factor EnvC (AmiA/AmiB activator)